MSRQITKATLEEDIAYTLDVQKMIVASITNNENAEEIHKIANDYDKAELLLKYTTAISATACRLHKAKTEEDAVKNGKVDTNIIAEICSRLDPRNMQIDGAKNNNNRDIDPTKIVTTFSEGEIKTGVEELTMDNIK